MLQGANVSGDTVKFFEPKIQELFAKFETKVGQLVTVYRARNDNEADFAEGRV